jgi:uncharacterized membrane protein YtjA (UPF0391 family)
LLLKSLLCLFIAVAAGVVGFSDINVVAAEIAKSFCFVFLVLFALGMLSHGARRYSN